MRSTFRTNLDELISIFYAPATADQILGEFTPVRGEDLPQPHRQLLDHHQHMTETQEAFHGCPVDVQVLDVARVNGTYSRRITLSRQSDGAIIQFGIVRLKLDLLDPSVRREIEEGKTPLGSVLIRHDVMRQVERHQLYRVTSGTDLAQLLRVSPGTVLYGRTGVIYCDDQPAVEVLEILGTTSPVPA